MSEWQKQIVEGAEQGPGPWPVIETYGELDVREWIHTNGAGGYAMSTVPMMHTRRYHGLLVVPLRPPLGRYVMLSHLEMVLQANGRQYRLSTHQFPGLAPTPGYRSLRCFSADPIPHWNYRIGEDEFDRGLCLARGRNIAVMTFTWHGKEPATLVVRPLLPFRSIHQLMHEHGAMVQRVTLRPREVEINPMVGLPPVCFRHSGVFVGSPDWWRRFEYLEDRSRAAEFQEDLWTPGVFELTLTPHRVQYLVAALGALPTESAADLVANTATALRAIDPGPNRPLSVRSLSVAAEAYRVEAGGRCAIISGYPWYGIHLRPAMVALPGLCLCTGQVDFARRVLDNAVGVQRGGLLPDMYTEVENQRGRPSPDATLWFFEAARTLVERVTPSDPFVRNRLYPALRRGYVRLSKRHRHQLAWITEDGLLANGNADRPITWMDGRVDEWFVTPRAGLAIEMQALYSRGCEFLAELADNYGDHRTAARARASALATRTAFRSRFWCAETEYPFDCLSERTGAENAWADASIRPNAVIALAIDPLLFEPWQAAAIVARARHELLTPRGLRTLAVTDSRYQGYCEGGLEERESAAHQGTVWPHLLGYFVRASTRLAPDDDCLRRELRDLVEGAAREPTVVCHVSEMADGEPPHHPRACPAHAMAVAELLRALVDDLEY